VRSAKSYLGRSGLVDSADDLVQSVIAGETLPSPGGEPYAVGQQVASIIEGSGGLDGLDRARALLLTHLRQRASNVDRGARRERARIGPGVQEGVERSEGQRDQYPGSSEYSVDPEDIVVDEFLSGPGADRAKAWLMDLWTRELRDSDLRVVRAWLADPTKNFTQLGRDLGISGSFIGKAVVRAREVAQRAIAADPPDFVRTMRMREELAPLSIGVRGRRASNTLSPDNFHVSYPTPRTIRVLVYTDGSRTYSGFVEARVGPNQVDDLVRQFKYAGFIVDPDDIEAAIEMA